MALGETIAVVDKSGKVISTSKTLLSVFKDAKAAYRERKAEIVAGRHAELEARRARRALEQFSFEERTVVSRRSRSHSHPTGRPPTEGGRTRSRRAESTIIEETDERTVVESTRGSVLRRHTTQRAAVLQRGQPPARSTSYPSPHVDMDLAYGELPEPESSPDEAELKSLIGRVTMVLDEAHCVQHSVTATIAALQKDPDALAAVALTLAEISNLVAKMAPAALATMKTTFPAVFALLASPHFMIAAGVGVGVVVVALGGYKIIKKIRERNAEAEAEVADQLQEIDIDVNGIDAWRRGVADSEAMSVGTSVDAELITPEAAAMRRGEDDADDVPIDNLSRRDTGERRKKSGSKKKSSKPPKSSKSHHHRKEEVEVREKKSKRPSTLKLLLH